MKSVLPGPPGLPIGMGMGLTLVKPPMSFWREAAMCWAAELSSCSCAWKDKAVMSVEGKTVEQQSGDESKPYVKTQQTKSSQKKLKPENGYNLSQGHHVLGMHHECRSTNSCQPGMQA